MMMLVYTATFTLIIIIKIVMV